MFEWGTYTSGLTGSTYGLGFVKGVLAPQPWTCIMPTGGLSPTEENLKGWFDAGVTYVAMGSKLMAKHADGSMTLLKPFMKKARFNQIEY